MPDQSNASGEITFALASRLLTNGEIALVLHLHRGNQRALSTTLATCDRQAAPNLLRTCRSHLRQRGFAERSRTGLIEPGRAVLLYDRSEAPAAMARHAAEPA